jgi:hypothetical protein
MSETMSGLSAESGEALVIPLPNVTEHPELGGVNWTMRMSFAGTVAYHRCDPGAKPGFWACGRSCS